MYMSYCLTDKKEIIYNFCCFVSGELFARCPIEEYPGIAVESVTDSSRYFVLRIMDDNGKISRRKFKLYMPQIWF